MPIIQPLTGHVSAETAYVIADYPSGFKARCTKRVWLERAAKRGYRFCSQTTNKSGGWNAPKKSTYTMLAVMGLDEEGHVVWTGCSMYDFDKVDDFVAKYGHAFDANQASDAASMSMAYKLHLKRRAKATEKPEPTVKLVDVTDQVMAGLELNNF